MLQDGINYIHDSWLDILIQVHDHILISLLALAIATVIGILVGYEASKSPKAEKYLTGPFQVLRVIPSLAILVLLIPIMGVGTAPAAAALTVLAIPPVMLNTCAGFSSVPPFMIESARGIGMTDKEILWKVRFPQALPMILAGVRSALVEVVASATLAAKIGAGGLGEIIFTGLGLNRTDLLLIGGILVAVLSLGMGALFDGFCRLLMPYKYIKR